MTEEATPYQSSPMPTDDSDLDTVLIAFAQARQAAPYDRTLLHTWTLRYPAHADALIDVSYAEFATGMTLADPLEDGPEDAETVALGRVILDGYFAPKMSLISLTEEAQARGLTPPTFARLLRLDTPTLTRLNQRLLDAATIPLTLVRQAAQVLERSTDEVAAYLRQPPRLAAGAQYKARQAPVLRESAVRPAFEDALGKLSQADQDYWQSELAKEGRLGDE